jgi:pimeloyl-ACP methyl ester carboxylesterase
MPAIRLTRTTSAVVAVAVLTLLAAAVALALVEALRTRADARAYAPPGVLVTIDGTDDHVSCEGSGGPTTVLIGGLGGDAYGWAWVQRRMAERGRVCAYDRPGYGYSTYRPAEADPRLEAERLDAVLAAAGENGPFVVVGHSLGGHYARAFATAFPDDVAALVLVDARPPDIATALPGHDDGVRRMRTTLRWGLRLAPFGAVRAFGGGAAVTGSLPPDVRPAARARLARPAHLRRLADEAAHLAALDARVAASVHPIGVPVLALVAGSPQPGADPEAWATVRSLVAEASRVVPSATVQIVPDADHVSLLTHREHAHAVADAIDALRGAPVAAR